MSKLKARESSVQIVFLGVPGEKLQSKLSRIPPTQTRYPCEGGIRLQTPPLKPPGALGLSTLKKELARFLANSYDLTSGIFGFAVPAKNHSELF